MINLVFDIETVPNWNLLVEQEHELGEKRDDTIKRYLDFLRKKQNKHELEDPFIPAQYQKPVAVAMIALDELGKYLRHRVMTATTHKALANMVEEFWWARRRLSGMANQECRFVSFNGKRFDIPVMEVCAMYHGTSMGDWLVLDPVYANQNPRAPYNNNAHLDLLQVLGNPTAGVYGSLSYWCTLTGSPGKVCMDGSQVANLFSAGHIKTIGDYCLADVMSTAALFLRVLRVSGMISDVGESENLNELIQGVGTSEDGQGDCVLAWSQECARIRASRKFESGLDEDDEPPF